MVGADITAFAALATALLTFAQSNHAFVHPRALFAGQRLPAEQRQLMRKAASPRSSPKEPGPTAGVTGVGAGVGVARREMVTMAARGSPEPGPAWLVEERDACGVGFIANPKGKTDHSILERGLAALGCMEHRGACLADNV